MGAPFDRRWLVTPSGLTARAERGDCCPESGCPECLGTADDEGPSTSLHGVKPFRSAATCCAVLQPAIFRSNMKYRGSGSAHGNGSMTSSVRRGSDSWSA